jgi:histidyl-tRNA synthetase
LGPAGVRALLGPGRKDESGDFTKGAGLSPDQAEVVMGFVSANEVVSRRLLQLQSRVQEIAPDVADDLARARVANDPEVRAILGPDVFANWTRNQAAIGYLMSLTEDSEVGREGVEELQQMEKLLSAQGYGPDRIVIDPGVVRGLGYYTGPVFEAELTFQIEDEKGRPRNFGSVAGGGRYDGLVKRFTGQDVPATGVSIGVDRLLAALRAKGRVAGSSDGPVVVTVMDRDRMADYMAMVGELRAAGIRAEVYLGNPKNFGNQLKYADKRASPVAVIQGGNEAAAGKVILKDLILGAKIAESATLEEWKDRPAQVEVQRGELVEAVRKMLGQ